MFDSSCCVSSFRILSDHIFDQCLLHIVEASEDYFQEIFNSCDCFNVPIKFIGKPIISSDLFKRR